MKKPEMIIFDYGHTLAYDPDWDALRGEEALLKHAVCIPEGCTMARIRQEISEAYEMCIRDRFGMSRAWMTSRG